MIASVSKSFSLRLFKLAESSKFLFCQPWVVSLQISAHEETSKTSIEGWGGFVFTLAFVPCRNMEIQDKGFCYPEYTALQAKVQVPLLLTGAEQLSKS